jgi:hypothetical protein
MRSMIIVVITDPSAFPCIVQSLRQVRLHVEAATWCGKSVESPGVIQVPDGRVCPACDAAIKAYSNPAPAKR